MTIYGYARVSTADQDLSLQIKALEDAGCDLVRSEKVSGTKMNGRSELTTLLQFARPGDTIIVTRVDRLARSVLDLQMMAKDLRERGITLRATEQPIDTSTAAGKAFFDMLGVFAEFETSLRRDRQLEGIEAAKKKGVYKGTVPHIDRDEIQNLKNKGMKEDDIALKMGIARSSVFRILKEIREEKLEQV